MTIIVVGDVQRETSIVPTVGGGGGAITRIHFDDGANIMDEGQLILTANPPPDNRYVILRTEDGDFGEDKFVIDKDGQVSGPLVSSADIDKSLVKRSDDGTDINVLNTDTIEVSSGIHLLDDAALAFTPSSPGGNQITGAIYRFGRSNQIGNQTPGLNDGIHLQRGLEVDGVTYEQKVNVQLNPGQPTISISGKKDSGVNWLEIENTDGDKIFAIHDDGTVQTPGWDGVNELGDHYSHTVATEGDSLYVGAVKLEDTSTSNLAISHLKRSEETGIAHIPKRLTQAPYNLTTGNTNVNQYRSVLDWMKIARDVAGPGIRVRDIFPIGNFYDDFTQGQSVIICDRIIGKTVVDGKKNVREINVNTIKGG